MEAAFMELSNGYRLMLMALILALNSFFAAAETALVSVRQSRLKELADQGELGAQAALSLLANPERLLSVSQVGLTLASLALGWLGEETLYNMFLASTGGAIPFLTKAVLQGLCFALAFLIMTYLHVVIGEVVPKNFAIERADRMAVLVAPALLIFYKVAEPFVRVIERSAAAIARWTGASGAPHGGGHSAEELKFIISSSQLSGHLTPFQKGAIDRMISLRNYAVREVMVPRSALVMVASNSRFDHLSDLINESRYSRFPVYEDSRDNVLGIIHVKDVLDYLVHWKRMSQRNRTPRPFDLKKLVRKVPVMPETKLMSEVLDALRPEHAHVAFVVDEFGTFSGMISVEDVIEHVFGDIEDEFDTDIRVRDPELDEFQVEGTISLVDLDTQYGIDIELPEDLGVETLAGYLMHRLRRIPRVGDAIDYGDRRFVVTVMDANRVDSVQVTRAA
jgi:putative hemolysin